MSAILKVLKKLEQDTVATSGSPLRREAKRHNQFRSKSVMVPLLIGIAVSILVGIGVTVLVQKPVPVKTMQTSQVPPPKPRTVSRPVSEPLPHNLSAIPKDAEDPVNHGDVTGPGNVIPKQIKSVPQAPVIKAASNAATLADNNRPAKSEKTSGVIVQQPQQMLDSEKNIPADENGTDVEPVIRILDDTSMDLQAISWASDPESRMAVINGKICREKDRVDGYVVKEIGSGDVVLAKGAVLERLVFKIR
ncbi:MAG: general secretion pathway protein GspB [Dissulfuribacterales bacterium]